MKKTYRGFTFIEILVIVAIVALLVTVTIVSLMSAQNKATVNAYKTSMKSTQTALELCTGSGGTVRGGAPGDSLCGGTEKYPKLPGKCGNLQFRTGDLGGGSFYVTTDGACRGCRLECTIEKCQKIEEHPKDCF